MCVALLVARCAGPLLFAALATGALAQTVRPAASTTRVSGAIPATDVATRADSVAARGDTALALRMLDSALRVDRRDAEAWFRRATIFWNQAKGKRSGGLMPGATIKQLMAADTSFRMARIVAPDSARYALAHGTFQLESKFAIDRHLAAGTLEAAEKAAERVPTTDSAVVGETAMRLASVHWRRYQMYAHRLQWIVGQIGTSAPALDAMGADPSLLYDFIEGNSVREDGRDTRISGEADYTLAERSARRALELVPDDSVARRVMFALLAERERWEELASQAQRARRVSPAGAMPILAHGLALHRLGRRAEAEATFDSALRVLPDTLRQRLTSLERLMRARSPRRGQPSDSAKYVGFATEQRALTDSMYWALADPLALTPENEFRSEHFARVAYAEVVFTAEDQKLRGIDTQRGDIHIRYGPPTRRNTVPLGEVWRYPNRLAFVFTYSPMYGTARLGEFSALRAEIMRGDRPASFRYAPLARRIDSVDVQVARFRVDASRIDSADVFVTGVIPVDSLLAGLDVRRTVVDIAFGVWTAEGVRIALQQSRVPVTISGDGVNLPRLRTWRQRLPMGELVYRVEAAQYDGLVGARGRALLTLAPGTAFGSSDLVVAAAAGPRPGTAPARWSDLAIAPSAGVVARGAPIALVWETYGLQADSVGSSRYRVTVAVQRRSGGRISDLATRIVAGVVPGAAQRATSLRYVRVTGEVSAVVDWLTLDLGDTRAGEYVAQVTIEDLVSGERTVTRREFRVE